MKNIDTSEWKLHRIGDLFSLQSGKANDTLLDEGDDCLYIGAKKRSNGVMRRCATNPKLEQNGNCILFICNGQGSVGYANYIDCNFIASTDIIAGYNASLNPYVGLFLVTLIDLERPKYSYGRKWKRHLANTQILLPTSEETGKPDWAFMENYMRSLPCLQIVMDRLSMKVDIGEIRDALKCECNKMSHRSWQSFSLSDLFTVEYGNKFDANKMTSYENQEMVAFVTRSSNENGVSMYVNRIEDVPPYSAGCMTVALGGSLGSTFIQSVPFYTAQNVAVLIPDQSMKLEHKLFIATLIHKEATTKFMPFGRELNKYIKGNFSIQLPICEDGNPDWQYMEDYIKSLPAGDKLANL